MTREEKIQVMEDAIRLMKNLTKLFQSELDELGSGKDQKISYIPKEIVVKSADTEKICIDEVKIYNLLKEIGIPTNLSGYKCIQIAVMLCIENPDMLSRTTKLLYPTIAKMINSTTVRVERAIRHAIEKTWYIGDYDKLIEIFGNSYSRDKGKTTNTEFISGIITYLSYQNC